MNCILTNSIKVVFDDNRSINWGYLKENKINTKRKIKNEREVKKFFLEIGQKSVKGNSQQINVPTFCYFRSNDDYCGDDFLKWYTERLNYEYALKAKSGFTLKYSLLEFIREAIKKYTNITIDSELTDTVKIVFKKEENEQGFHFDQLSDGEKRCVLIIGHIAKQFIKNLDFTNKLPSNISGVVLIDEIEQHLHPKWQLQIIDNLINTFPNIQFILTTHSPLIVNSIQPGSIHLLKNIDNSIKYIHPDLTYGRDINWILEELMETSLRPTKIEAKLREIDSFMKSGKASDFIKAKDLLNNMLKEIGDDREINSKLAVLKRLEVLGR